MKVYRFSGSSVKEALQAVRNSLGTEAMILSNKPVDGRVEIIAMKSAEAIARVASHAGSPAGDHETAVADPAAGDCAAARSSPPASSAGAASAKSGDAATTTRPVAAKDPRSASGAPEPAASPRLDIDAALPSRIEPVLATGFAMAPAETPAVIRNRSALRSGSHHTSSALPPTVSATTASSNFPDSSSSSASSPYSPSSASSSLRSPSPSSSPSPSASTSTVPARRTPTSISPASALPADETRVDVLGNRLADLASIVERGFASLGINDRIHDDPSRMRALSLLVTAGFAAGQARRITERMPDGMAWDDAFAWLRSALERSLRCADPDDDVIVRGGVYALVGPTGVGKTTTTAKLAARCALAFGAQRLALITTDGYRVAAREQLKSFGRILGVTVHWIQDQASLKSALADLRDRHLILIDTVGASQRDRKVGEQLSMFTGTRVKRLLVLNAAAQQATLEQVASVYQPAGLAGVVISKVDEAVQVAPALDVAVRHRLPIHYVTNGQRVPEDMQHATARQLVDLALGVDLPAVTDGDSGWTLPDASPKEAGTVETCDA